MLRDRVPLLTTRNLPESVIPVLERVAAHPKVEKLYLYGSRAVGDHEDRSDVDVAIVAPAMSREEFALLWYEIDDARTYYSIEIVNLEWVGLDLRKNIDKLGVTLYEQT